MREPMRSLDTLGGRRNPLENLAPLGEVPMFDFLEESLGALIWFQEIGSASRSSALWVDERRLFLCFAAAVSV